MLVRFKQRAGIDANKRISQARNILTCQYHPSLPLIELQAIVLAQKSTRIVNRNIDS